MRRIKKFKSIVKSDLNFIYFNKSKIEKFKRTKWKKVNNFIVKKLKGPIKIKDNFKKLIYFKFWKKRKSIYSDSLICKRSFFSFYDHSVKNNFYKGALSVSKVSKFNFFSNVILKPLFRIDIFLWRLKMFNSSYEVRQAIFSKNILVNNKIASNIFFLKKNDIISIKNLSFNKLLSYETTYLFTFVEFDYYTNTVVVLKNLEDLSAIDINLFLKEFINFNEFRSYLKYN